MIWLGGAVRLTIKDLKSLLTKVVLCDCSGSKIHSNMIQDDVFLKVTQIV